MKGYAESKPTGIDWLPTIPQKWEATRMANLGRFSSSGIDKKLVEGEPPVRMINFTDVYSNENLAISSANELMVVTAPVWKIQEHQVRKGDLLFLPSSETEIDLGVSALVDAELENTVFSYHLLRFQFQRELFHSFKKYLCNNKFVLSQFSSEGKGTTRQILGRDEFRNIVVVLPPLPEQRSIARFLDDKTAKIDTLIEKKRRLIELLKEERQAVINRAVTKGLNPNAKMKHSGIEWLGDVPEEWEVKRMKYLVHSLEGGKSVNSFDHPVGMDEIGVLKTSCVYNYRFEPQENKLVVPDELELVSCPVKKNTIIISRMNTPELVGASGYVGEDYPNLYLPDRMWLLSVWNESQTFVKWLSYVLICQWFRSLLSVIATGTSSSMKNISMDDLLTVVLPVPPFSEQESLSSFLDTKTNEIDTLISNAERAISLLTEYRTALITEAVTGKIQI